MDRNGRRALLVATVAVVIVVCAEVVARIALAPIGSLWAYWNVEAARKFEWYRRREAAYDIVICGDSTAANDCAPDDIAGELSATVYNVGWSANFPEAFRVSTLPLLRDGERVPRVVVVCMSPAPFRTSPDVLRFEQAIRSSVICRKLEGETVIQDSIWLTRVNGALAWRRGWFGRAELTPPPHAGYEPLTGKKPTFKKIHYHEAPHNEQRLGLFAEVAAVAEQRGFQLVFLIPPTWPGVRENDGAVLERIQQVSAGNSACTVVDARDAPGLTKADFWDPRHLTREGARKFSVWLANTTLRAVLARSN